MQDAAGQGNRVVRTIPSDANQGVAVDAQYYYAISSIKIEKFDKVTDARIATWEADLTDAAFAHFKHMNSGTVEGGKLYCAHSRFSVDPNDNSVEIWNVEGPLLEHEQTLPMPRTHGSLTWIDRHDGFWWMCYAVYGEEANRQTKLVQYTYDNGAFVELRTWLFPMEVIAHWDGMSCSGGSWGPDGYLYTTGHDHAQTYVLTIDAMGALDYVRTEKDVGLFGQAIAWDRSASTPTLWGIQKRKCIAVTRMAIEPKRQESSAS